MIEEEYEQEDNSQPASLSGLVRQNAQMENNPTSIGEQNIAMGLSPWAHMASSTDNQAYRQAMVQAQKPVKAPDPRLKDAEFYTGLGDYGGAQALMNSKGAALFNMDEEIEIDDEDDNGTPVKNKFYVGPKGNIGIKGKNVPASMLARKYGVGSVPFRGGDMQAVQYRSLIARVQKFTKDLNALKKIYQKNTYLGTFDPSMASAMAQSLESSIKTDYLAIMKDTKGLGGNVSDNDMLIAESMVPQRASRALTRLGGNEMAILLNAKQSALSKLMEVGAVNGIELRSGSNQQKMRNMMLESATKDTSVPR